MLYFSSSDSKITASKVTFIIRLLSLKGGAIGKGQDPCHRYSQVVVLERYLCWDAGTGMAHLIIDRLKFFEFPQNVYTTRQLAYQFIKRHPYWRTAPPPKWHCFSKVRFNNFKHTRFNVRNLCILATQCVYTRRMIFRINTDYLRKQGQPVGFRNEARREGETALLYWDYVLRWIS
jgi:hypothetical protein